MKVSAVVDRPDRASPPEPTSGDVDKSYADMMKLDFFTRRPPESSAR
jgi:hypothetical protein